MFGRFLDARVISEEKRDDKNFATALMIVGRRRWSTSCYKQEPLMFVM